MLLLRRGLIVLVAVVLCAQVVRLQVAEYFTLLAKQGEPGAAEQALAWDADQPESLRILGREALREATEQASAAMLLERADEQFRQALRASPVETRAMTGLLLMSLQGRELARADALGALAERLGPVNWRVQRDLVPWAIERQDWAGAVGHMAKAMVGNNGLSAGYYPMLRQLASDPEARAVLEAIANDPRPYRWWNGFFAHVANEAEDLEALRGLVALRSASKALALQEVERRYYINRLRKEGLLAEAYLHWVNGLSDEQLQVLGYVYDGGFRFGLSNDAGFGWYGLVPANSGVMVNTGDTYGAGGDSALRVSFSGKRSRFSHLYQQLFLPAGRYWVVGRGRPDQLEARRGVQWRVTCASGGSQTLGESKLFVGTGDWREFRFEVIVPSECKGQTLRLNSAGDREVDHELKGTVWFDDLRIEAKPA